ncbi:type II secretion system protein N [Thiosulfativibrio zosterae]|uniref:Type II secretion system protein N n=1 Tax=Thiosulfativibrio zosterae TaxID=2675053 RepID=A0A6F8PKR8_9GAMM|nr:type II secretion system protein N [Thiosulfativibrio zosterae]BBP42676.1 hypothetical protein THMIRHAT_04220 [Thiosulfativibrio zosterae]
MTLKRGLIGFSLFGLTLLVSVVWHFPASYLVSLPAVQHNLPKALQLSNVQGTWWAGQTQVNWQQQPLGQVAWQWQPLDALGGQLGVTLKWQQAEDEVLANVKTNGETLTVANVNGHLQLSRLSGVNPALGLLADAKGDVIFKNLNLVSPLQAPWPTEIAGQVVLVDLNAMGMEINTTEITPSLQDKTLVLTTQAKDKGWQLSGKTLLNAPNRFTHDYQLTANTAQTLPDWTPLFMRQTSPTQAILKGSGAW